MPKHQHRDQYQKYGLWWNKLQHPSSVEIEMIRGGGRWQKRDGTGWVGEGLFHHIKELQKILHPEKVWHKWNDLLLKNFIEHRVIGVMGPASSGKTREAADFARMVYYAFPDCTTIILTSTERETLEDRVWGEIKNQHREARKVWDGVPGHLIESKQRLVTDSRHTDDEGGRDFRNGMVGVPTKKGGTYQGMGSFAGRKNKIVILIADEASLLPRIFVDAFANLSKNNTIGNSSNPLFGFKGIALGNPKDTTDALGVICEPSPEMGGWDGGIDQTPETKTWPIRWPNGVCVQLPGTDSPNLDGKLGIPLITQEHIDADIAFYGKDSLQFTMMDQGMMPRGQGSRRVITRQKCLRFWAMEDPIWANQNILKIGFLDAAYRGVGGDRCIFGELHMGTGIDKEGKERPMLALAGTMLVPISALIDELPEDQIAKFVIPQCLQRGIPQEKLYFDSTGRGSLMSAFARHEFPHVQTVEFGGNPTERPVGSDMTGRMTTLCKDYYYNFVSELWYSIGLVIESGQFRGLTEDVMTELTLREWGYVGKPVKIQVEPKSDMKKKSGRSPDLADGLAVGIEGARRCGFIIQKLAKFPQNSQSEEWKDKLRTKARVLHESSALNYSV